MMFEHDHSAARGEMVGRSLIVFKHENALGNAPAHKLFERVTVERVNGEEGTPASAFSDYNINFNADGLEALGVEAKQYF